MKLKWFYILVFVSTFATAQVYEAGVFVGGANGISDVGSTRYVNPNAMAYGLLFKWNKSLRYAWRVSVTQSELVFDDRRSNIAARTQRGFYVQTQVNEFMAGLEVNFKSFELHRFNSSWTPYIATGASYYRYRITKNNFSRLEDNSKFALPLLMGMKIKALSNFILGIESGIRYSFNDNLDGSYPTATGLVPNFFGKTSSKDWYVFSGITLTYSFGKKPCTQCYN